MVFSFFLQVIASAEKGTLDLRKALVELFLLEIGVAKSATISGRSAACVGLSSECHKAKWGFPKIRGPFLVVLIIRALLFWGPH